MKHQPNAIADLFVGIFGMKITVVGFHVLSRQRKYAGIDSISATKQHAINRPKIFVFNLKCNRLVLVTVPADINVLPQKFVNFMMPKIYS